MAEGMQILHVDDDHAFSDLTADTLEYRTDEFVIETVLNVSQALETIETSDIDCIVSDYEMPDMTGIEFLTIVRQSHPHLPFILFTGKGSEEVATEAIRAGATDYLQKRSHSEQFDLLIKRIRNAVTRYRTEHALAEREHRIQSYQDLLDRALSETNTYLWEWDLEADIVRRYPETEPIIGLSSDDIGGVFDGFIDRVHPADQNHVEEAIKSGIETKTGYYFDCRLRVGADEWRWVRDYGEVIDNGTKAVGSVTDITDSKAKESQLFDRTFQLADILDDVDSLLCVRDADGHYIQMNDQYQEAFGIEGNEAIGQTPIELFGEEAGRKILAADAQVIETKEPLVLDEGIPNAPEMWESRIQLHPITDQDDSVTMICGISGEIDTLPFASDSLEAISTQLRIALAGKQTGLWEWDIEADQLTWDQTIRELFGYTNTPDSFAAVEERIHPEDRHLPEHMFENALESGQSDIKFRIHYDDVLRWVHARGEILTDDAGEPQRMVGIITDIDEQKVRERELLDHRTNLERLLEASTKLTMANSIEACRQITIEAAVSILGFDWCTIATPDATNELFEIQAISDEAPLDVGDHPFKLTEGIAGEAYQTGESTLINDVPAYLEREEESTQIHAALTIPIGERGIFQAAATTKNRFDKTDQRHSELLITVMQSAIERVEQESELYRQNERLDRFASIISHDLRNPLNIAQGRVNLLAADDDNEHIEAITAAHARMETMIEELLTAARVGNEIHKSEEIDLHELVRESWTYIEGGSATIHIETDAIIEGSRTRLAQLVENLLTNAVHHGGDDVTITVADLPNGFVIEDDGPGIDDAGGEAIFEPGYSTAEEGAGFGLSIVSQVVEAHGWSITVTESESGGARFEITDVDFR